MEPLHIRPGTGIYGRAEAARLLGVTAPRLRRWVSGYTYRAPGARQQERRHRPPVVQPDLPAIDRNIAVSFVELMELRVVKELIARGMALQSIRAAAEVAAARFDTSHPFASRRVYTDGRAIFAEISQHPGNHPDLVELSRHKVDQVIAGAIFEPFLREIDFDETTSLADRWWPLGRNHPVVLDPEIAFGAPTIAGTAVRTSTLARMAEVSSPHQAAEAYELKLRQVIAAVSFERQLAAA